MGAAEDDLEIRICQPDATQTLERVADRLAVRGDAEHLDAKLANHPNQMVERIARMDAREVVVHHLARNVLMTEDRLKDVNAGMGERAVDVAHRWNAEEHRHVALRPAKGRDVDAVVKPVAHTTADRVGDRIVRAHPGSRQERV